MDSLWQQAQHLLALPTLQRYFDARHYRAASNELPYVTAQGEVRRIDRVVEFDDEVWVLDYKTGERVTADDLAACAAPYRKQVREYCAALREIYRGKPVRGALVFGNGLLYEVAN